MRSCLDGYGGNFASPIDKLLGNAFWTVKNVSDSLDDIRFVSANMALVNQAATSLAAMTNEALVAALTALLVSLPTTQPSGSGVLWLKNGVPTVS